MITLYKSYLAKMDRSPTGPFKWTPSKQQSLQIRSQHFQGPLVPSLLLHRISPYTHHFQTIFKAQHARKAYGIVPAETRNFHNNVVLRWCDRCGRKIAHSPKESPAVAEHLSTISGFSKRSFSNWATLGVSALSAQKPQKMASLELLTAQQFARNMAGWQNFVSCTSENLHDFGTFGTDNSCSPLTSPLGHSSTDPRDHTLVNHWKTKLLDPKGTIKCCLAHPRIELAFSINRLQGSKSFTFSFAEGSEGFHRSPAHINIESASQTCGLSFCSMLTRYSRYSRGLRWLQSITNTWKSRELEESKQIISWDDWSSIRDRNEESLKKHGIECKRSRVRNKLHLFVFHSLECFLLQM